MRLPAICLSMVLLTACGPSRLSPDLKGIYSAAARQENPDRNPIIVIPGILGSRLVDDRGRVVWGEFGSGAVGLASPEGRRLMAVPMSGSGWPRDEIKPDGALERLKVSFGLDFQFDAYAGMLRAFGVGGYLDPAHVDLGDIDYGPGHYTCFQFSYDWRRSNAENAALLGKFIEEKRRYVRRERIKRFGKSGEVKFDIVAHSMGGLVARYYLMYGSQPLTEDGRMPVTWAGTRHVEKLVMVATPNGGSIYPVEQFRDGFRLARFLPRVDPAVVATMPSMYELLPREEDAPVIDKDSKPVDIYQASAWESLRWGLADPAQDPVLMEILPDVADAGERREIASGHLAKMLRNARAFHRAMNARSPLPAGVEIHAFAGDAVSTGSRAQVGADGVPAIIDWIPGDGTVTRKSMLMDQRTRAEAGERLKSPIPWTGSQFIFSDHLRMTNDPSFVDNVLYQLLESD